MHMRSSVLRLSVLLGVTAISSWPTAFALALMFPTSVAAQFDTVVRIQTQAARRATLIIEVEIGSETAGPEYIFNGVRYVVPTKSGSILAVDVGGRDIAMREYSSTGTYVRTWARAGSGPGEIRGVGGLAVHPDGSVFLWDAMHKRMNIFSAEGKLTDTWPLSNYSTDVNGPGLSIDANGILYLRITWGIGRAIVGNYSTPGLLRLTRSGQILDTLRLELPTLPSGQRTSVEVEGRGPEGVVVFRIDVPYIGSVVWNVSPLGYLITGKTERYAFELRPPQRTTVAAKNPGLARWRVGDTVISIRRNVQPIPITTAERDSRASFLERQAASVGGKLPPDMAAVPRTKPAYKSIHVGQDARIWLSVHTPSRVVTQVDTVDRRVTRTQSWVSDPEYDIFEPDGTYLGTVALPQGAQPLTMRGNTIWGVRFGNDGTQRVFRASLRW